MTDAEVIRHIREWAKKPQRDDPFASPTDGCGKKQNSRWIEYHREHSYLGKDFELFVLGYADMLEIEMLKSELGPKLAKRGRGDAGTSKSQSNRRK